MFEDLPLVKKCSRCKTEKPLDDFNKSKKAKYGRSNHCRICGSDCKKEWYLANRERELEKAKKVGKTEKVIEQRKIRYRKNWEIVRIKDRAYSTTEEYRARSRARRKEWRKNQSEETKLRNSMRSRFIVVLKDNKKQAKMIEIVGCSFEQLKKHLESTWKPGMTWENHGNKGWEIDHVIPCKAFDFSKREEQLACFHYTNLQALWGWENRRKGSYVHDYQI